MVLMLWLLSAATAAPLDDGAVATGVTLRASSLSPPRAHGMLWLRPGDRLQLGAGLGHATAIQARSGLSLRLTGGGDVVLTELGERELVAEGAVVATVGASDGGGVVTVGPAVRLGLVGALPISVHIGWVPEVNALPSGGLDAVAFDAAVRAWF